MALIVQKFGGSSVADRERIFNVARIISQTYHDKNRVVVVVSAQGDTTDHLLEKAGEISANPCPRELDMLLATGEQISVALLCMALGELGVRAISLTGWQAGFHTDRLHTRARIRRLETERIESELDKNQVVIVAGFQGVDSCEDITTLGRGGSDTSAVALACALGAQRCMIFTDVDGVYTADPRVVSTARRLPELSFEEMLELASVGAQVLHNRSVELAQRYGLQLEVLSSLQPGSGTLVKEVCEMEGLLVKSVTADSAVALFGLTGTGAGMPLKVLSALAARRISVQQVLQKEKEMYLVLAEASAAEVRALLAQQAEALGVAGYEENKECACLSVVGGGLRSDPSALPRVLETLQEMELSPELVTSGEIRISVLIPRAQAKQAVRAVHSAFFETV